MTKPFELTATDALELINNKDLSYYEWIKSCFNRIKERDIDVGKSQYYVASLAKPHI